MTATATKRTTTQTRSLAYIGLTIALMTVSAWVTVPLGPVPFTLQTFVIVFAMLALTPKQALASIGGYIVLGAIGVPVFSSMRGGIGVLAGPTGGFIWGFMLGMLAALGLLALLRKQAPFEGEAIASGASGKFGVRAWAASLAAAALFLAITYACGWFQLMFVASMTPLQAFAVGIAPFIPIDAVKIVAAVFVALSVRRALPSIKNR